MSEIIVGTYEDFVVGYQIKTIKNRISLEQSFAVRLHSGSIKCLATNSDGSYALSVGIDEVMNLVGLKRRKLLHTDEGPVNCVAFCGKSHVICGLESGDILIYECKNSVMELAKTLKGHKAGVTSISVHSSGKVLLSLCKDGTMRTWNLIKGRCAYVTNNIRPQSHLVVWSDGARNKQESTSATKTGFMIAANNEVYLYNDSGDLEHSVKLEKRINSIEFITSNIFVVASDSGKLDFYDFNSGQLVMQHQAHENRIKSVRYIECDNGDELRFATASSDGVIKLWSIQMDGQTRRLDSDDTQSLGEPTELASTDSGARLTCMTSS